VHTGPRRSDISLSQFASKYFMVNFKISKRWPALVGSAASDLSLEFSFLNPTTEALACVIYASRNAALVIDKNTLSCGSIVIDG